MLIDCDTCQVQGLACGDCVVGVLLGPPRGEQEGGAEPGGVELDGADRAAIAVLASSGLVPPLRLVTGPSPEQEADGVAGSGRSTSKDGDGTVKRRATG